jgi:hypothetical protein
MTNDPFYLIGRRAGEARADKARAGPVLPKIKPSLSMDAGIRAENSGVLRTWGWGAATFGAGAILWWIASAKRNAR